MMAAYGVDQQSMRLSSLLSGIVTIGREEDRVITGLALDSRRLSQGELFMACAGTQHHGMAFLEQALEAGAAAVLYEPDDLWTPAALAKRPPGCPVPLIPVQGLSRQVSRIAGAFYAHPSRDLFLVGITGTNGKTSCSHFLAQALAPSGRCGVVGTLGNGFPGDLQQGLHTTPDPVELQAVLAQMRSAGAESVAMEVSSHALDQGRAADLHFDLAIFTNLSRDHLDYHGSMEAYAAAKQRLFQMPGLKAAVINLDDPFGRQLLAGLPLTVRPIGYGLDQDETQGLEHWLGVSSLRPDRNGTRVSIRGSWGAGTFRTRLLGRFNISNLLAVLAVLLYRGVALDTALERLSHLGTIAGRMEILGDEGQPRVVVDFAHTPDALSQALEALRPHTAGELILLFGCGGDRDRGKRPRMGAVAERLADQVWLTDDNPRSEDGDAIVADILAGMERPAQVRVERDRAKAIKAVIDGARAEDLILIAGKGHERYQQVGELKHPFSDREQVLQALAGGTL